MRLSALQRIAEGIGRAPHEYRPTLQTFADLSPDEVARQLQLAGRAKRNAERDLPPTDSASPDDVEYEITERIFSERKAAHQTLIDHLETYAQRLTALDFHGRFTTIQQAAPLAVSEFIAEAKLGRDDLFQLRRSVVEHERERDEFKKQHRLRRAPRLSSTPATLLKVSVLAFLFIFETYVNGLFLAKGAQLGILGGVVEALAFAILNVLVSFFIGLGGVRQLNYSTFFWRLVGVAALIFWLIFSLALNLALAHYREISGVIYEDAGARVITRLFHDPLGLVDIRSWLFFAIGFGFSVAALTDGILFTDPFPGYAGLEKRVKQAHENYILRKGDLINELKGIRDDASAKMEDAQTDLRKRRAEYNAILEGRTRIIRLYEEHQNHLERTGKKLLTFYRSENTKHRSAPAPKRFDERWHLDRLSVNAEIPESLILKNLDSEIAASNEILKQQIIAIHKAFDDAVEQYRQIDDLVPEDKSWPGS